MVSSNENSHFIFRLKKTVTLTIFTALNIFFTIQDFSAMALALKNRVAQKFFTVLNILFTFKIFKQLALALKNRVCPENFHWIQMRIFEELAHAVKTEFFLIFFTVLDIVFTFRIFEHFVLYPEKETVP